jgi:two-component system, sensor histidine kinase RegB
MTYSHNPSMATRDTLPVEAQRRLILVGGALVFAEALGVAILAGLLHARLPLASLAAVISLHLAINVVSWLRLRRSGMSSLELVLQLAADASCIGAVVYLTGGYANPFISLLLVPLILAAVSLPPFHAWGMACWVGVIYTLLMRFYQPLEFRVSQGEAVNLHLLGMWLNFLMTSALVAAFVGRLSAILRRRDAQLAEAREQRLRDEQLFALGLQAASAAHDLATPMASVRITLDELRRDYAGDDELSRPLSLLSDQLARMESVLARLGDAARGGGPSAGSPMPVGAWVARGLERWGLMWPKARVDLDIARSLPNITDDSALEAVFMTLLNNAAEASLEDISVAVRRDSDLLLVTVADRGAGLMAEGGKPTGWGVGLELANATLARLGGNLAVSDRPGGGVIACMFLPISDSGGAL